MYEAHPSTATTKVFTTSVCSEPAYMDQALAVAKQVDSQECNGELRKTG
jgi:hypothetical protein